MSTCQLGYLAPDVRKELPAPRRHEGLKGGIDLVRFVEKKLWEEDQASA